MGRRKKGLPVHGWLVLDKPINMTSTQAVGIIRRVFNAQKAGHSGTLDPLATGILPIALPQEDIDKLMDDAMRGANAVITVDLVNQEIKGPDGGTIKFEVDPFRKQCLINGWDDIGLTLRNENKISDYEARAKTQSPWL